VRTGRFSLVSGPRKSTFRAINIEEDAPLTSDSFNWAVDLLIAMNKVSDNTLNLSFDPTHNKTQEGKLIAYLERYL
jgi:hypothetical protein